MKRIFKFIALILALIMLMTSCTGGENSDETDAGTTTDNTEEKEDTRFLYTIEGGRLVCYDVVEQKETIVCPDPLCEHDTEDCTASDVYLVHITDDYIAIVKEVDDGWEYNLYLYDLTSGEISTTYTFVNEEGEEEMSQTGSMNLFINPETGDWFIIEPLY